MRAHRSTALRRVTDLLRAAIVAGSIPHFLPSEQELQRTYGASRNVIRDALATLRREGFIDRHQGAGTFVVGRRYRHRVDRFGGFRSGAAVLREPIAHEMVDPAPPVVVTMLELVDGSPAVMIDRLTVTDGEPTSLWTSYLPPDLEPIIERLHRVDSLHDVIAQIAGAPITEVLFSISAGIANGPVAEVLEIAEGDAVIRQQRVARLATGRVVEFAVGWMRGDRMTVETMRRSDGVRTPDRAESSPSAPHEGLVP